MRLETSFARARRWGGRIAALGVTLLVVASSATAATVKSVSMKDAGASLVAHGACSSCSCCSVNSETCFLSHARSSTVSARPWAWTVA